MVTEVIIKGVEIDGLAEAIAKSFDGKTVSSKELLEAVNYVLKDYPGVKCTGMSISAGGLLCVKAVQETVAPEPEPETEEDSNAD